MSGMDITYINTRYYPAAGGVETHMHELVKILSKNHQMKIITQICDDRKVTFTSTNIFAPKFSPYQDNQVWVYPISPTFYERIRLLPVIFNRIPKLRRYFYENLKFFGLKYFMDVFKPKILNIAIGSNIIHSFGAEYLGITAQQTAKELKIPFVITPFVHPGFWGDDEININMYKNADAIISLLNTEKEFLISKGIDKTKIHVIGVSPQLSKNLIDFRKKYGIAGKMVLFIGIKREYKGYKELLEATKLVWQEAPDTYFVFIGPRTKYSEKLFTKYKDFRIIELGKVSLEEKTSALAGCDIFCLPSISEILPTVFLEAWYFEKPVIAGDIPVCKELVKSAGITVAQSKVEIANAILTLLKDENLRIKLGIAGKKKVDENYTQEKIANKLEKVYKNLMEERLIC
jgi:glycosyltransferase involved in cell wall biosynthesis